MSKRKAEDQDPATPPPAKKKTGGILKKPNTPSLAKKVVSFPPPAELHHTLKMFSSNEEDIDEEELAVMISSMESLQGPSLVLWLTELSQNIAHLARHKNDSVDSFVTELLRVRWAHQDSNVAEAYINFITNLVSANTRFVKQAIGGIIDNFKGLDREQDPIVFENSHAALKSLLEVVPVIARDEILLQINRKFPFHKIAAYKQICFISSLLEMMRYIPDSRDTILRLLMERLIKLDAHLSRDFIDNVYREREECVEEEDVKVDQQVQALDLFMKLMFTFVEMETHNDAGQFDVDKASCLVDSLMKVYNSHLLPTFNILHTQFIYLYLSSLSPQISSRFLLDNWKVFTNPNKPSIIRQTAMAYIASFLSRASYVSVSSVMIYLDRISQWALTYITNKEKHSSGSMDFMYTDLNHHGPFYAACQAIFYVFAFRHKELTATEARMKSLQSMSWQTLITSPLNPLRVCLPGVVRNFSAIARNYQLAYCNSIIQRNNRINLPVVGSLSSANSTAKPLLLDCFFPFDPYMLEESKMYVEDIYRPYSGEVFDEASDEEEEEQEDDSSEDSSDDSDSNETPDSGIGRRRRKRIDSFRSSASSNCSRTATRKDSVGRLNDLLMQDIATASQTPGF